MPHNAYSSHDGIRKEGKRKGFYTEVDFAGMPITYQYTPIHGDEADQVEIVYKAISASDSVGYYITYQYDAEEKNYLRYVNGTAHLDEESDIHLRADNIIIQKVAHRVIDDVGRKDVDVIGSGSGYYINRGEVIALSWEKSDARGQTRYYKSDGSELLLNPGMTWIQVIPSGSEPKID
jgi:hypothetical protein